MSHNQENLGLGKDAKLKTVESYEFQPIKGFPMLSWRGKRPFTSTQFFPAQLKETYGEEVDGWRNKIFWGDNLQVMSHLLKEFRGQVDLIYIDPPFDSKVDYKKKVALQGATLKAEATSFEEKQYTDIWSNDEYLQFMYERLCLCRELLSSDGAIYVHLDYRKSHYIKMILDEIFGEHNMRNEIIWDYSFRMMESENSYNRKHDNILFYAKSDDHKIDMPKTKWTKEDLIKSRKQEITTDKDGVEWISMPGAKGNSKSRIVRVDDILKKGKAISDVWQVSTISSSARERTGYPTQKPEELISRIILASSPQGGLVFDCFMGAGTTQAAAMKLGRKFIGADINVGSIQTTTKRLIEALNEQDDIHGVKKHGFEVYNVNNYEIFRNPAQAKDLLIEALEIQKLEFPTIFDGEKDGRLVKIMPVNRISTKADLNEIVTGFDYKTFERRQSDNPKEPVESILLVCMGHEVDLKAQLEIQVKPFQVDVEVVDILRDKSKLEFRRDSNARLSIGGGYLTIDRFYPMNLLQKLSIQREEVFDWRELVESIMIDWNYDGSILRPSILDIPEKNVLVSSRYRVPKKAGVIRVKITDLLSDSWEGSINE